MTVHCEIADAGMPVAPCRGVARVMVEVDWRDGCAGRVITVCECCARRLVANGLARRVARAESEETGR